MSEEDDSFLNVKRSLKKRMVKHSTPVDSIISRTCPSLTDLTNQSIKEQDATKRVYGSPMPKSNLLFSRRRLSTVLASDESYQEPGHKVVPNTETQANTRASMDVAVTPKSGPSWLTSGIPGIKDPLVAKYRKKKMDKTLQKKKQREWLLRQLNNIEEATKHELTVEEA
ncbi:coiled-coil domain-containing protein 201 isoform X2 [Hirundo rustica]|uniref:coiled-coil domain-containing protein 201 isoform X2 n=1 Tax=Hirundo rustica TaxID=43150 RepID=UPI001A93C06B|nr:coiled-coil domain-containing protein 201 isoform X2 [Hirundo rustica]